MEATMGGKIRPFLMFEGKAEAAMNAYVGLIPDSEIIEISRYGSEGPGPEGSVVRALFRIADQEVYCIDSHVHHAFAFTPSFSFFVECGSEAELEGYFTALLDGGQALMPPNNYGFSRRFGWLNDRFGVSWQFNLA
jgi:predicted 3-demethylubiquinone-9 3-methyltransferase (glyoxalase superfamily)